MRNANASYGGNKAWEPSRLIIEVDNPADERIAGYFSDNGYETEDNKLDAGKITWFLKLAVGVVMTVGLVISLLSFYILLLSIYLLLQKNTDKLENLILMGYSTQSVAKPYQILTVVMNFSVLLLSVIVLLFVREIYMDALSDIISAESEGNMMCACFCGVLLFVLVSVYNVIAIRKKINSIM